MPFRRIREERERERERERSKGITHVFFLFFLSTIVGTVSKSECFFVTRVTIFSFLIRSLVFFSWLGLFFK